MSTQTEKTTAAAAPQGSHHWVMTLELPGRAMQTTFGTWTPPQGATRHDAFMAIKANVATQQPEMERANVVFFALEPNQL
ncbi:hypothetical protein ACWGHM_04400 [Streptomyces sp. NPDC054904]|uniref:hypothetical protein n=1 Tax=Streptomyces sp. NPDC017949 TaxID=3365020 RepID=UPI0037B2B93E